MRNLHLEAAIWNLFTSLELFEAAAKACDSIVDLYGPSISKKGVRLSGNKEMIDKFTKRASEFRQGAELAKLGDYRPIYGTARRIDSDIRSIIEEVGWMNLEQFKKFSGGRFERLGKYANRIEGALNNAITAAASFFHPNPDYPERSNDDDGYPGDSIVKWYENLTSYHDEPSSPKLPDPLPEYVIDKSVACQTGDEVPWTGVWYPATGLEKHSLTFAIKGLRMPPAFRIIKTVQELKRESDGAIITRPKTVAVATPWHPVFPSGRHE